MDSLSAPLEGPRFSVELILPEREPHVRNDLCIPWGTLCHKAALEGKERSKGMVKKRLLLTLATL